MVWPPDVYLLLGIIWEPKEYSRVKELFTKLLIYEAIVGAVSLLIVEVFPSALIQIFGATNESVYYTDFAIKAFRIYLCMIIFACINKATFIFMQKLWEKR